MPAAAARLTARLRASLIRRRTTGRKPADALLGRRREQRPGRLACVGPAVHNIDLSDHAPSLASRFRRSGGCFSAGVRERPGARRSCLRNSRSEGLFFTFT